MTRFRSNIKRTARYALLALLLVITPALTGLHAAAASPGVAQHQPLADTTAGAGDLAALSEAGQSNRRQSEECAFCSALAAANAILFAPPPLLLLPQVIEFLYQVTDAEFVHLRSIGLSSRRHAPPAS